jgi:hypothetical protein
MPGHCIWDACGVRQEQWRRQLGHAGGSDAGTRIIASRRVLASSMLGGLLLMPRHLHVCAGGASLRPQVHHVSGHARRRQPESSQRCKRAFGGLAWRPAIRPRRTHCDSISQCFRSLMWAMRVTFRSQVPVGPGLCIWPLPQRGDGPGGRPFSRLHALGRAGWRGAGPLHPCSPRHHAPLSK